LKALNRPTEDLRRLTGALQSSWTTAQSSALARLFVDGWSHAAWGRWGIDKEHELRLFFAEPLAADLQLEVECYAALVGTRTEQQVDVFVGDEHAAAWTFTRGTNSAIRTVPIKAAAAKTSLPELRIRFVPRSVVPLDELGPDIRDKRRLGLGIKRLRFVETTRRITQTRPTAPRKPRK
jgi:hypothetical protein